MSYRSFFSPIRPVSVLWLCMAAVMWPAAAPAQGPTPLTQIETFDMERLEVGRVTVLYSAGHDESESAALESGARRIAARFRQAGDFFAGALGGDFRFTLALLSPRDWNRVGGGQHALPWSSQPDRLVVVPVRMDMGLLVQGARDSTDARKVVDIIGFHQLGHVVAAAHLHPAGFREARPPVRWFDELLASYLGHWYMRENEPELADFEERLAEDVVAGTEPRFTSLEQFDQYHDGFLTSPQGANTLGWYLNAFNLEAAELYDDHGPEFIREVRTALPWDRLELWTTEMLLEELEELSPGFLAWEDYMASITRRRY